MSNQLMRLHHQSSMVASFSRFGGVEMECPLPDEVVQGPSCTGRPCHITGGDAQVTEEEVFASMSPSVMYAYNSGLNNSYRGVLGAWASHISVLKDFVKGNPPTPFLLTLEDDTVSSTKNRALCTYMSTRPPPYLEAIDSRAHALASARASAHVACAGVNAHVHALPPCACDLSLCPRRFVH